MTREEFSKAVMMVDCTEYDMCDHSLFCGFALPDFKQVVCTLRQMAGLIAYQCKQFNGQMDGEALNEIWDCRRRFLIVG